MSKDEVLLDVAGVRLELGDSLILDELSFKVIDRVREGTITGQVVGLLGPSGVGKTRLLRIIAGLDTPNKGTVRGQAGAELEPGSVGFVFQDYPLLQHHSVRSNLELAGRIGGMTQEKAHKRSTDLLETFRLGDRAGFYPAQLSGGQRQRVAIAQQIMQPCRLLLMDEPFSGLDPEALDSVMRLIVEVANMDELNTIVLVTHDIRAAMAVSDTLHMLGRQRKDATLVPGARVLWSYDMVERGLAWKDDVVHLPAFSDLEKEIKARFKEL
jgi:polar amino acid transport system ATP-binding protein/sulfate transport system ATP-binding protein